MDSAHIIQVSLYESSAIYVRRANISNNYVCQGIFLLWYTHKARESERKRAKERASESERERERERERGLRKTFVRTRFW